MISRALIGRMIRGSIFNTVLFALLLFGPAGTVHWWRAWVLLGVLLLCSVWTICTVFLHDEALLRERLSPPIQRDQPLVDKIMVFILIGSLVVSTVFLPLDVFHFHLLGQPSAPVSTLGLALVVIGWVIISYTFKANSFAAPVVKEQGARGQRVIDTGPYRFVRHPMYSGVALYLIGVALWLESNAGVLVALGPVVVLAVRILFEERFLKAHLDGYDAYATQVRYRLVPLVW